jgi:hypothetical protein
VARSFGRDGDEVARRRSCGAGAVKLWQRRAQGATQVTGSADAEKSTALLELGARAVARHCSSEEAEDGGVKGGGLEGGGGGIEGGGAKVGQPNGAKPNFTVIRVSRRRGYSPYT